MISSGKQKSTAERACAPGGSAHPKGWRPPAYGRLWSFDWRITRAALNGRRGWLRGVRGEIIGVNWATEPLTVTSSVKNMKKTYEEIMSGLKIGFVTLTMVWVSACQVTEPVVEKSTRNVIAISYDAYGSTPTVTPAAIDMAIEHCKKHRLFANYRGATIPNALTAKEVHTFVCERTKTDDSAVIIAQNAQYMASSDLAADAVDAFVEGYNAAQPTYTSCSTIGFQTTCRSY